MNRALRRTLAGVTLGVVIYVAAAVWFGVDEIERALATMNLAGLWIALGLSCVAYGLRFLKWECALAWLSVRQDPLTAPLGRGRSLLIYLAGLSMSVTPGKLGEVLRSGLLKSNHGVAFTRTAPFVVADRAADVLALVLFCLFGMGSIEGLAPYVAVAAMLTLSGIAVVGHPTLSHATLRLSSRIPGVRNFTPRIEELLESAKVLLHPARMGVLTVLSLGAWGLECVGYGAVIWGFTGTVPPLSVSLLLWSATTLIGALLLTPGGLGATEGSLAVLAPRLIGGLTTSAALASTFVIRAATLWFGEVVGALALWLCLRHQTGPAPQPNATFTDTD